MLTAVRPKIEYNYYAAFCRSPWRNPWTGAALDTDGRAQVLAYFLSRGWPDPKARGPALPAKKPPMTEAMIHALREIALEDAQEHRLAEQAASTVRGA